MKISPLEKITEEAVSHSDNIFKKVMVRKGEIPNLNQFAKVVFPPGEIADEHIHEDMYEVFLTEEGSGIMRINGQDISILPGTCVTVEPGESHEVINTGNEDLVILTICLVP